MSDKKTKTDKTIHIGAVNFFNAKPLIHQLNDQDSTDNFAGSIVLHHDIPARLGAALDIGQIDVGLVPSIDYQRSDNNWIIMPTGAIGSIGEVLTVRVFSKIPLSQIKCLACDSDSHTSVTLARIIWQLRYGIELEIIPLNSGKTAGESNVINNEKGDFSAKNAVLLIGDKVLGHLGGWPFEVDLGQMWADQTGLPFVYALWALKSDKYAEKLSGILQKAFRGGVEQLDSIAAQYGAKHGFKGDLAGKYLRENICYEFGSRQLEGLNKFYELAFQMQLIEELRPIRLYPAGPSCPPGAQQIIENVGYNAKQTRRNYRAGKVIS